MNSWIDEALERIQVLDKERLFAFAFCPAWQDMGNEFQVCCVGTDKRAQYFFVDVLRRSQPLPYSGRDAY